MSADALRQALASLGLDGSVEARGALAVLSLDDASLSLSDPDLRARAVSLASEHGFTNLALELRDPRGDSAPVRSD
jgi:hypothetical protein